MKTLVLLLTTLIFISCNQAQEKTSPTATLISDVTIIDVRTGDLLNHKQIVIDSGKIKSITDTVENPAAYTLKIDGTGKYVLPGLAEMHAHIPQPPTTTQRTEETLFLYLSNGITIIRGMLGHPDHLALREKAKNGEILSPRIFTSSPSLNGNTVTAPEEARTKVTAYQKEGYDFLKIHPGIRLDVFDALVKTANEVGIPFAGHVPVDVGIKHALESKYASIDHVDGFLEGLVPASENVNPNENGFFGYNFTPLADVSRIDTLVQLARANKVWVVPTQSLFERWFAPVTADELLQQPEMKYMPTATLNNWKRVKQEYMQNERFNEDQWKQFDQIRKQLINRLQEHGHGILLGSDAPQLFNVPGFSIHHEMEGMYNAGLTPLQIIQSGTINPAIYFGMEHTFGEIREGLDADMILVDSNPLEDIKALRHLSGVMLQGKWMDKEEIDQKLRDIAANAARN